MIRALAHRQSRPARDEWRRFFIPVAVLQLEELGRALVIAEMIETRWSNSLRRRLWRLPE